MRKYLFIDTVVLLHYKSFEEIPWKELLGFEEDFEIVLCETVLAEIDKHKDNQRGKIRNRAKKLSGMFGEIFLNDVKKKVPVTYCTFAPPTQEERDVFDLEVCDNRIILSALHSGYPLKDIVIVSSDNNLLIKSKTHGLNFYKMGDAYMIKGELTDEEKQLKEMEKKLANYENRLPKPFISFDHGEDTITIKVPKAPNIDEELNILVESLSARFPEKRMPKFDSNNFIDILSHMNDTPDAISGYNEMRERYINDSKILKTLELSKKWLDKVFVRLDFYFTNIGNAQTGDSDVFIDFPDNLYVYKEKKSLKSFSCNCPIEPSTDISKISISKLNVGSRKHFELWDENKSFKIENIKTGFHHINHGITVTLNEYIIIDTRNTESFDIEWSIFDSNLPNSINGKLRVNIERE